ncbi:lipase 1-like [Leguminivora glycinivorella]|uniref:lipase 1-like n=1 Tax=Leguminivora glycinivorella TaxID=1035111 RepID=UPI00200CFC84|nr:lipase 1-like [Leguminivora glycinivorella]
MAWTAFNGFMLFIFIVQSQAQSNLLRSLANITFPATNAKDFIFIPSKYGYKAEKHEVTTDDGYILTVHRIPSKRKCTRTAPILLMHGLLLSSECFVVSGPNATAFVLARNCYDVWVGNVRGNHNSRRHVTLHPDRDLKFWKFSVDEMGYHDIPAMVDYVLNATDSKKLIYIGYSQGSATFFIMNSEKPEYAKKISLYIGLAPSTTQYHTKSELYRTAAVSINYLQNALESAGIWEIFSRGHPSQITLNTLCQMKMLTELVCDVGLSILDSPHADSITPEILTLIFEYEPSGTSIHNLARYGQAMNDIKFSKFDYGTANNLKLYGSPMPPEYNLGKVTMPAVLFYGQSDHLVDTEDMDWVASQLPNVLEYVTMEDPLWNHFDMAFSRYWKDTIFVKMKKYLNKYGNCY